MTKGGTFLLISWAILLIVGIFCARWQANEARKDYNHGICVECGGDYQFSSAVHYQNAGNKYFYTCEDCGHTIITYSIMK